MDKSESVDRLGSYVAKVTMYLVVTMVIKYDDVRGEVFTFGQDYDSDMKTDMKIINQTKNIFLIYTVPRRGILFQMSAYFSSKEELYLQIWRPTNTKQKFSLQYSKRFIADKTNALNVMDAVIDPEEDSPECPRVEIGDQIGFYSSRRLPIPFYLNPDYARILHRAVSSTPRQGDLFTFDELRPMGKLRFIAKFFVITEETSDPDDNRGPQHGRRISENPSVCYPRGRGTSIPRRRTVMSGPRPTEGTTYRNAVTNPGEQGDNVNDNNDYEENGNNADAANGDHGTTDEGSQQHSKGDKRDEVLSPKVMYIIIGSLSVLVIAIILAIVITVLCRRHKRQAEPSIPMRPDGATLHLHMKNSGYRGNSVTNPRYVASQARPKIQNTENEYLELGKPSDELYEEIPDSTLPDLKQVNPTPPIPRSPNPDVNNQSGAQRNDSNIRPISQSGLSPLRLSEISNKSTYLDLLG